MKTSPRTSQMREGDAGSGAVTAAHAPVSSAKATAAIDIAAVVAPAMKRRTSAFYIRGDQNAATHALDQHGVDRAAPPAHGERLGA